MAGWQKFTIGFSVIVVAIPWIQGARTSDGASQKAGAAAALAVTSQVDVEQGQLLAVPAEHNWISYNGDYTGRRYSGLREINTGNVSQLKAQWVFHPGNSSHLETTPVAVDGLMFVTSANDAFALDAQTGRIVWHYTRPITEGLIDDASQHHNRGVGVWHKRVYMETDNAHLLCLDARSGHLIWDVAYTDGNRNYGATSAPLVVKNMVLVGTSGGDDGVRGFVAAYDAETGKECWRFWTIPGPGEFGSSSWPGESYKLGGGTTWMPGTFDAELNTLYWGTSNPAPDFDGDPRPGDDLYTDSLLALDADSGKLKWHFQFTPHDLYDYDAVETPMLVDANYKGQCAEIGGGSESQWVFVRAGPHEWEIFVGDAICGEAELGDGDRRERAADSKRVEAVGKWNADLSGDGGSDELAVAGVQSGHVAGVFHGAGELQYLYAEGAEIRAGPGLLRDGRAA